MASQDSRSVQKTPGWSKEENIQRQSNKFSFWMNYSFNALPVAFPLLGSLFNGITHIKSSSASLHIVLVPVLAH